MNEPRWIAAFLLLGLVALAIREGAKVLREYRDPLNLPPLPPDWEPTNEWRHDDE